MKKITTVLLSSALLISPLAFASQAEANILDQPVSTVSSDSEIVDELVPTPPVSQEFYGAKPPSSSADTHDLSKSAYNYQVERVGAQVYTSKFLTGKTSMTVTVKNWSVEAKDDIYATNELTVLVYDADTKKSVGKKLITIAGGEGSHTFTGLSSSKKYYIEFSVFTSGYKYSFNGSVK